MVLSKEDILRAVALGPLEEVDVKGLGKVRLREMSAKELSDFWKWWNRYATDNGGTQPSDLDTACKVGPSVLVDGDGKPLFTPEEFAKVFGSGKSKPSRELTKVIFDRVNASITGEGNEEVEKNSEKTDTVVRRIA